MSFGKRFVQLQITYESRVFSGEQCLLMEPLHLQGGVLISHDFIVAAFLSLSPP